MNLAELLSLDDSALLNQCTVHTYRASGPGGQKRNKTSSAVRLHHEASGCVAKAEEDRSQHVNRRRALRRLRLELALTQLFEPDPRTYEPSPELVAFKRGGRLTLALKAPGALGVINELFSVFATVGAHPARAAAMLGITTGNLMRVLELDPALWRRANELRTQHAEPPLQHSKR